MAIVGKKNFRNGRGDSSGNWRTARELKYYRELKGLKRGSNII